MSPCPDEMRLSDLIADRLSPSESRGLREHIDQCVGCRVRVAEGVRGARPEALGADTTMPTMSDGRFRLETELARGGLGAIFRGRDARLEREVAIKQLLTASPDGERRFRREALITARLQHPAIVPVYEVGR